ncbi:hypothetical protein H2199_006990 [Coniosporium tulheliwenetii]|uniref:Uncharacterized protein n=1 Tax=Coniosporium tulheliwenetii TaxID=3383036 RepID=A0ACC2YSC2_9PEZI|nr:hypothetical protein H2199_006990 [Cladosporium sp. JES 115]
MKGKSKDVDTDGEPFTLDRSSPKQHRVNLGGKRLSGRPAPDRAGSRHSLLDTPLAPLVPDDGTKSAAHSHRLLATEGLVSQITSWIKDERKRRAERKSKGKVSHHAASGAQSATLKAESSAQLDGSSISEQRRPSDASDGSTALENLENILEKSLSLGMGDRPSSRRSPALHHRISARKLRRQSTAGSSDTDYVDGDTLVPSSDAVLDNSKTMAYAGGAASSDEDAMTPGSRSKEKKAWAAFKYEIVRLTHTLKLKGWRRVPMERSGEIEVERLSGALTNAVYVVSPPKDLPTQKPANSDSTRSLTPKKPPPKLLLRIYGPQVEHLIDREAELQILRRLARKRIGPRLLGTFKNGRFEEFFHARTLTPKDLRNPETSKQIAKRMRELHEGIDLLPQEREDGPFVWRNWDKWVDRCEQLVTRLDEQVRDHRSTPNDSRADAWKQRGFVCGTEWAFFRQTLERYRTWLDEKHGGPDKIKEDLVFAHNDTQYGNILRLEPAGESPLSLPTNEHKQLVVIDFEYANANTPGLEFANHFTEWCYNYHDEKAPYALHADRYPTPEEQHRFIRAYKSSPYQQSSFSSSISTFMLDSRVPPTPYKEAEAAEEAATELEVRRLLDETRHWRLANSAQWVAWGVVQAKIPGLPSEFASPAGGDAESDTTATETEHKPDHVGEEGPEEPHRPAEELGTDPLDEEGRRMREELEDKRPEDGEDEGFDYLGYARERALFFWGDVVSLGILGVEELPEELRGWLRL